MAAVALAGCGSEASPEEPGVRSIAWARAEAAGSTAERVLPGRVEAPESAAVGFDVAGRIEALSVDIGDRFERGDILGTVDAREYSNRVESRRADLESARARLEQARSDYRRQVRLHERGAVAEAGLDRAREARATARARVAAAEARLRTAQEDLEEARLRAPYAGAVTARHAEPGERVGPGQPVLGVIRGGAVRVRVHVPETLVQAVEAGQRHRVTLPGHPDLEPMTAKVRRIGAGAGRAGLFPVDLALRDTPAVLRPGMTARVRLSLPVGDRGAELVAIPATAYAAGPGGERYTFVFDPDRSRIARRAIDVARVTGDRALVASGLRAGEIVAARGIPFLRDGERVRRLGVGTRRFDSEPEAS